MGALITKRPLRAQRSAPGSPSALSTVERGRFEHSGTHSGTRQLGTRSARGLSTIRSSVWSHPDDICLLERKTPPAPAVEATRDILVHAGSDLVLAKDKERATSIELPGAVIALSSAAGITYVSPRRHADLCTKLTRN